MINFSSMGLSDFVIIYALIISLVAGAATGISVVLVIWLQTSETERRLWANKAVVRDGQQRIFPEAMVGAPASTPQPPITMKTPFRAGLDRTKEQIKNERQAQPLPPEVQEKIKERFERENVG